MKTVILNAKVSRELKSAVRKVAFEDKELTRPGSASELVVKILKANPKIKKELANGN